MTGGRDVIFGALALRPGGSGVQTYGRELLAAMFRHDEPLNAAALCQRDAVGELPAAVTPMVRPVGSGIARAAIGLAPALAPTKVFHSLDVDLPVAHRGLGVATVHDLSVFDTPWASGTLRARGERALLRHAFARADLLIAVSNFTAQRLLDLFGREATVIELAPASWARPPTAGDIARVAEKYRLPDTFVLQVGTVEPRKQVAMVADACAVAGIPCVLAGAGSVGPDAPRTAIGLGYVDLADLPALYASATVTAYASTYEGFGLPPLEAMACGGAVVASAVGALPDVVGDGAILLSDNTVTAWAEAIADVIAGAGRDALVTRGQTLAAGWDWNTVADRTVDAYRSAGASM